MQSNVANPKTAAVLGAGVEGMSATKYLEAQGYHVTQFDEKDHRTIPDLTEFDLIVRSPGVKPTHPRLIDAQLRNQPITSVTNLFFEHAPTKNIVGVTGTKGKGTTATMIYHVLRADGKDVYLGGNVGTSPLDFIDDLTPASWVVLELSSFQLMDAKHSPHIAVVVMTVSEHLDWHTDQKEYWDAKAGITKHQQKDDVVIYNAMFEGSKHIASFSQGRHIPYDLSHPPTNSPLALRIPGSHNLSNAYAAYLVSQQIGVDDGTIVKALSEFQGLPHRLELVGEVNGVRYYDDSISTIPETTIAAIRSFNEPQILLLGGSTKHSDFAILAKEIKENRSIKAIIGMGNDEWKKIKAELEKVKLTNVPIINTVTSMRDAVKTASELAQEGDVVLLSPACASFDMFHDYKDRGDQFKHEVQTLSTA